MQFRCYTFRFAFTAREPIRFPTPAANLFRGEFGRILHAHPAAYRRIFAPSGTPGPSGLADPPRPFVLRARHLDGAAVPDGAPFHLDLHFFDLREDAAADLVAAFRQFTWGNCVDVASEPHTLELDPSSEPVDRCTVRFLTPTELKSSARVVDSPEFGILAARIRDRISTLSGLYGEGPLELDFRGFAERAARVRISRIQTRWIERERRSARTGQVHPLGGLVGEVEYEGDLREFLPYLEAAVFTGVGRQTVWGKGEIAVSPLPSRTRRAPPAPPSPDRRAPPRSRSSARSTPARSR